MKRFLILLSILLSVFSIYSKTIRISPYGGFANINMASTYYRATEGLAQGKFPEWKEATDNNINSSLSNGGVYTNAQMIGLGAVEGITKEGEVYLSEPITITVTCTEGYNFVSQSNSEYKRPFELVLIGKYDTDFEKTTSDFMFVFDSDNQSYKIDNDEFNNILKDNSLSAPFNIWFDLVLVLPGEVSSTGNLEIDGRNYPLKEADDYLAVITYTITQGNESQSVSIPFSGYYSSIIDNDKREPNYVSLSVAPTGNAANLNMNTDRGRLVKVADVDFMMDVTPLDTNLNPDVTFDPDGLNLTNVESTLKGKGKNTNIKIFFSANNAPGASYEEGFKLVHSSVISGATLTNYNSAPFTVVTEAKSGRTLYKRLTGNEMVGGAQDGTESSVSFTGDEWADDRGNIIHSDNSTASCIYPDLFVSYPRKDLLDDKLGRVYYAWEGEIYVLIDSNIDTRMMLDGRYTSSIYVHVIAD